MGRRGGRSGKGSSGRGRRPQASKNKGAVPMAYASRLVRVNGLIQKPSRPKINLLPMVPTEGVCPLGKLRYGSPADAEEALRRAQHNRVLLQSEVTEDRWYPKPGDRPCECHGYHLTSKKRKA